LKAARGHSNARRSLPRFCHESNRIDLIETDAAGVRTRGITRFQLTSIAIGAISNPSVSATKPWSKVVFLRFCHEMRHSCHDRDMFDVEQSCGHAGSF
jgi:hypothetical protein